MREASRLAGITKDLLDDLPSWRLRAIERIELSSTLWAEHEREVHVKPLSSIPSLRTSIKRLPHDEEGKIELVIPITHLPRVPILDLHIEVAGDHVYRIPMDEGAELQAGHIGNLASRIGFNVSGELHALLVALFYFPSRAYEEVWSNYNRPRLRKPRSWFCWTKARIMKIDPVQKYVEDKMKFKVGRSVYRDWEEIRFKIAKIVSEYEPADYKSPMENPLIALPHFAQELQRLQGKTLTEALTTDTLKELDALLVHAKCHGHSQAKDATRAAEKLIVTYAVSGVRSMVFSKCKVPVNEPFIVTAKEKRPIHFTPKWYTGPNRGKFLPGTGHFGYTAWEMLSFADAQTNHVSIRVSDTAVRLKHSPTGDQVYGKRCDPVKSVPDEEEKTSELYMRHDSTVPREDQMWVKCHLRLTVLISCMLSFTIGITLLGLALLWWRGVGEYPPQPHRNQGLAAKDAAVVLIPVAFSATFLLSRDTSTMSARLRRFRQAILMGALFLLLSSAFILYFFHHVTG